MEDKDKKALEALLWLAFNTEMDDAEIDMSLSLSEEEKRAVDGWDIDIDKIIAGIRPDGDFDITKMPKVKLPDKILCIHCHTRHAFDPDYKKCPPPNKPLISDNKGKKK